MKIDKIKFHEKRVSSKGYGKMKDMEFREKIYIPIKQWV